jgi:predicted membrane protein
MPRPTNLSRRLSYGLQCAGESFRAIGSILFRLALVLIFFWYLCEFASGLTAAGHPNWAYALQGVSLILALTFAVIVGVGFRRFDPIANTQPASIVPYILLNLPPIAAVAIAVRAEHEFSTPLLKFTYGILKQFKDAFLL